MSAITPSSDLYLLKVPIEIDNANQLTFSNATAQYNYFSSCTKIGETDFTYQRKDGVIRYPAHIDSIINYNYVMYRNENYSNKWFYAFIDGMRYVNDGMTEISIKTDVWQTWQFDLEFKKSFVEREHVNDDTIGKHTIHEGLETGEMVINGMANETIAPSGAVTDADGNAINATNMIVFQVSENISGTIEYAGTNQYNGIFSGLQFIAVQTATQARNVCWAYDQAGKSDAIVAIFYAPTQMFQGAHAQTHNLIDRVTGTSVATTMYTPADANYPSSLGTTTIAINTTLDGYTPKNNKMFTGEFNYLYVTNNAGSDVTFNYEDFYTPSSIQFYLGGNIGQGCSLKLCPIGYKHGYDHESEEYSFGMNGAKMPICAWSSDYYTNWLTQNAVNMQASAITGTISGFTSGGVAGGIVGGIGSIFNSMVQGTQASIIPDQSHGNTNCSDITFSWRRYFSVKRMSVRAEMASVIDGFFSMFGYKVNSVKVPNITGRQNWNYVKTVDCNIHAYIPQEDCNEIKQMFNDGVTLWHNASTFLDYSQNNPII